MARWLELLAKYRNMDHLQIQDGHLDFFQYFSLDVIAFFVLVGLAWVWVAGKLLGRLGCRLGSSSNASVVVRGGSRGRRGSKTKKIKCH